MSYPLSEEEQQKEHGAGKSHMVASSDHVPRHEPTLPAITTPSLTAQTIHPRNDPRQHAPTSNENRSVGNNIGSSAKPVETEPLLNGSIQEEQRERQSLIRYYKKLCCPFGVKQVAFVIAAFITALFIIAALSLFVADLVLIGVKYDHSKDLVVRNDYVLLEANSSGLYSAKITFNNTNFTSDSIRPNMITYIYQVPCYEVHELYESQIKHQPLRVAFNACGIYNNKCVLDEYWYCSKSKAALMFYAFNFTSVNRREELKIVVFDDAVNYMSYLSGKESLEGAALYTRDVPTDKRYWEFDFTSARMKKAASYYFFVIVDLKGGTEPFLVTKNEVRAYFNLSMILPNCKVMNNESCSSNIGLTTHDSCFLAQAQGQYNASSYGSKDMVFISYKLEYFSWSIFYIVSLLLCGVSILFISFIFLCILKSVCYRQQ